MSNKSKSVQVIDLSVLLGSSPDQGSIQTNRFAQNSQYLPVSHIEGKLDAIFGPMGWKISNFLLTQIGGKQTGDVMKGFFSVSLSLSCKNPDTGEWVERSGVASGSATDKQIETFAAKLKAEAFKNAAKSFGATFGRNLNRKQVFQDASLKMSKAELYKQVLFDLESCESPAELYDIQQGYTSLLNESWFKQLIRKKESELQPKQIDK